MISHRHCSFIYSQPPSPLYNVSTVSLPSVPVERHTTLWPHGWATLGCWPVRTSSSSCVETKRTWMLTERSHSWRLHALLRRTVRSRGIIWSFLSKPLIIAEEVYYFIWHGQCILITTESTNMYKHHMATSSEIVCACLCQSWCSWRPALWQGRTLKRPLSSVLGKSSTR